MRALVIEHSKYLMREIAEALRLANFSVDEADSGGDGLDFASAYDYDVIVCDLDAPGAKGPGPLARLRDAKVAAPVVILSSCVAVDDKVLAFRLGADDYVGKPFHLAELLARVNAVIRRTQGHARAVIRVDRLEVDVDAKTVSIDDRRLSITNKEYAILEYLCLRKGAVVDRSSLIEHIYCGLDEPDPKALDVHVCRIRRKILDACGENYLQTEWGRGFVVREQSATAVAA